jgi:hypothetical protein
MDSADKATEAKDRGPLGPDQLRTTLQRRLLDAEGRVRRAKTVAEWQKKVVDDMSAQGRADVTLGRGAGDAVRFPCLG